MFIIGEIGINHGGNIDTAKELIKMANICGVDAVKFQKRDVETVYPKEFLDSYRESPWGSTQRAQKEGLEFGKDEYDEIDKYCKKIHISWFASAFDLKSQKFLQQYDLKYNKIAHQMTNDLEFMYEVAEEGKQTFISRVDNFYDNKVFMEKKTPFTIMYCVADYPCADEACELTTIKGLGYVLKHVGYSCHNPSILAPSLAVAMGAEAIEVHITLDRTMYGSDQSSSFEKMGLEYIVRDCHRVKGML